MCGIAGIIYRDGTHEVGRSMTRMLQSMKHRGPDSTGYALYRPFDHQLVMRYKLADANTPRDFEFSDRLDRHQDQVIRRLRQMGADIHDVEEETEYAYRVAFTLPNGNLKELADRIENIPDAEVLSLGHALEIVKDLGDAEEVAEQYDLKGFTGTHAIGHVRMATESDVDISGERMSIPEILDRVGEAAGVPCRVGREIEGWASTALLSSPSLRGPARAVIESLSQRYNLESHLTRQGLVLHQRGKAPANRLVQAGRVQWALSEARDRRAGRRPDEPDAELARGMAVALSFEKARLRQVAETIHDRTGIPVYLDSTLWIVNPTVSLEPGKATLGEALDALLQPLGAASDANPRRIILFRP